MVCMPDFGQFEKIIGITFKDKGLLRQAFVHRSYINENKDAGFGHNERLEFLGDAVLELVITDYLYKKYPDKTEGDMTSYRSALVNATTCAAVATKLTMNDFLMLSRGEAKDTGRARQFILANTLEALIGAIYLDQGYDVTRDFIYKNISPLIDSVIAEGSWIDSKSLFQERAQDIEGATPIYKTLKEVGPDHDKRFTVGVYVKEKMVANGDGKSKQDAEQAAAKKALEVKNWA
ncbi:MAG TPA: ribonuclease III [Candidatus Nanoarchaeia archaeon]|nr:ribonuclease III [Candidatus Nanoarchaeia archaeon]